MKVGYFQAWNTPSIREADVLGCSHCAAAILKPLWQVQGAYCHSCDGPICAECDKKPGCEKGSHNWKRDLDRSIQDAYRREQNAKILGV